jgi:hypothetical protein
VRHPSKPIGVPHTGYPFRLLNRWIMNTPVRQKEPLVPPSNCRTEPHIYHVVDAHYSPHCTFGCSGKRKVPATKEYSSVGNQDDSDRGSVLYRDDFRPMVAWYAVSWQGFYRP